MRLRERVKKLEKRVNELEMAVGAPDRGYSPYGYSSYTAYGNSLYTRVSRLEPHKYHAHREETGWVCSETQQRAKTLKELKALVNRPRLNTLEVCKEV